MAQNPQQQHQQQAQPQQHHQAVQGGKTMLSKQVVKASTAGTVGVALLLLSGLTLAATVVGLTVVTPLLVVFSPVLVPAAITTAVVGTGLVAGGGFGLTGAYVFYWMYKYVTGGQPAGAERLERARGKAWGVVSDIKDRADITASGGSQGS